MSFLNSIHVVELVFYHGVGASRSGVHAAMQVPWAVEHAEIHGIIAGGAVTPKVAPHAPQQMTAPALHAVWQIPQAIGPASEVLKSRHRHTNNKKILLEILAMIF